MNENYYEKINRYSIYVIIVLATITLISYNDSDFLLLLTYNLVLLALSMIKNALVKKGVLNNHIYNLILLISLVLINRIGIIDISGAWEFYFYIIIVETAMNCSVKSNIIFTGGSYMLFLFTRYLRFTKWNYFDFEYFLPQLYDRIFYFLAFFLLAFLLKQQLLQKQLLINTANELEVKTNDLAVSNDKLRESMKSIKQITMLNERNRISREIHDTVGHILTTVLVEMEAAKRLIVKNPELSTDKINLAQGQVRRGLNEIRETVRILKDGSEVLPFISSIESLLRETVKHTQVQIKTNIKFKDKCPMIYESILFNATQEGLTNGIKHGNSSNFELNIIEGTQDISFCLKDNGKGCSKTPMGFGLSMLSEQAKELGGRMNFTSELNKGFLLQLSLPLANSCHKMEVLNDKNNDCG